MPQPKMDPMALFEVMKHRDNNPMVTKDGLVAWAKRQFPRDQFIASTKFTAWIDGGKGSYLEREMHRLLVALVSMDRLAQESQDNLEARVKAEGERDEAREMAAKYRDEAHDARLQLALQSPPPDREEALA